MNDFIDLHCFEAFNFPHEVDVDGVEINVQSNE